MHTAGPVSRLGGLIQSGCWRQSWTCHTNWPLPPSALSYCHRLPLLTAEPGASSGSSGSSLASWPSCCSHHPVTSGTGGPHWHQSPHDALGSDPPPGPFRPVSGCGHMRDRGQREPRREYMTMYTFPRNSRKTVACLPPSQPANLCPFSPHLPWPPLQNQSPVHPYTLQPPL